MPTAYQIPEWLQTSPNDVATKFVSGLQIGAQLGEARNRLAQQAQQSAVENQVTQDKLASSMLQQQQELAVKKAYEDQQVNLAQQKIQAAQAKVGLETAKAARQFQAQKAYQTDYQAGLDIGLDTEEAARASYFKNLVQFGSPAGAASAMRAPKNNAAQVPQIMTTPRGTEVAYNPGTGHFAVTDRAASKAPAANAFDRMDYAALQRELGQLQKANADPTAALMDKAGTEQRNARIQAITQQLQRIKSGASGAPASALPTGGESDWDAPYGGTPAPAAAPTKAPLKVSNFTVSNSAPAASAPPAAAPAPTAAATIPSIPGISDEKPTSQAERKQQARASSGGGYQEKVTKARKDYAESIAKEKATESYNQSKALAQNLYTGLKNYAANPEAVTVGEEEYQRRRAQLADLLSKLTPEDRKAITGE